ncbi:MAG: FIST N-terminal domain-containing protein [Pseudomonadota bacterium]
MKDVLRPSAEPNSRRTNGTHLLSFGISIDTPDITQRIVAAFSGIPLAHVIVFASPSIDFPQLIGDLHASFKCPVAGCTSAGEISEDGFVEEHVLVVGLPSRWFAARTVLIDNLSTRDFGQLNDMLIQNRMALTATNPGKPNGFSFLMVDALSRCADQLLAAISPGIRGFPLFGGSVGDGLRFQEAAVAYKGRTYENAATLTFVVTTCDVHVFSANHMAPGETRMVVTQADPADGIVRRINDEPAAIEYARLIGKDPLQLDDITLAENPLTLRAGETFDIQAIQRVTKDGHLVFSSTIEEGTVLSVAQSQDIATHMDAELTQIINGYGTADFLVCDCVGRRIEAQKTQSSRQLNEVVKKHGVRGFSACGQQIGPLHMTHTLTGVALFPPERGT